MPLQYTGVLEEHRACREHAVVFDVSHLGTVEFSGPGARDALQWLLTNDLNRIGPGKAQYTHLLDPDDAHVVDDIIVWWVAPDEFLVMPNASNTDDLVTALTDCSGTLDIRDVTAARAVLAVQGPEARALLQAVDAAAAATPRFAVTGARYRSGGAGYAAGTGYTGEDGVELHVEAGAAPALWDAILGAGIPPAGLGARDTLRLEAGLPLHGHELGPGITPLQAGLGWVVSWTKGDFRGKSALAAERERGVARRLRGLVVEGRQPPRQGYPVLVDGKPAGEVTSGNFSPVLEQGIALAFVPPTVEVGAEIAVDIRNRPVTAKVVKLPFVPKAAAQKGS